MDENILKYLEDARNEFLWGLVKRHIPELKKDVQLILAEYEDEYNCKMGQKDSPE